MSFLGGRRSDLPGVTWKEYVDGLFKGHDEQHILLAESVVLTRQQQEIIVERIDKKLDTLMTSVGVLEEFRGQMLPLLGLATAFGGIVGYAVGRFLFP